MLINKQKIAFWILAVFIIVITLPSIASAASEPTDYVSYYDFNTGSGSTLYDQNTTNANDGTINGGMTWDGTDYPTYAVSGDGSPYSGSFDGVDDYIVIPDSSSLDITGEITVAFWMNIHDLSGTSWIPFIAKGGTDAESGYSFYTVPSDKEFIARFKSQYGDWTSSASVPTNEWVHWVVTLDNNGDGTIYKNNVVASTGTNVNLDTTNNEPLYISTFSWNTNEHSNAEFDDVAIWNRALSASEVSDIYNSGFSSGTTYPLSITDISISPTTIYPVDSPTGSVTLSDTTDAEVYYQWIVNGANVTGASGTVSTHSSGTYSIPTLSDSEITNGDTVKYDAYAQNITDGSRLSETNTSTQKTVQQITVQTNSIDQSTVYTDTSLTATTTVDYSDSSVYMAYEWQVDSGSGYITKDSGTVTTTSSTDTYSIPSSSTQIYSQTDDVRVVVTPQDSNGNIIGLSDTSTAISIQNRNPSVDDVSPSTTQPADVEDFDFTATISDDDGDTMDISWTLYKNSAQIDTGTISSVSSGSTSTLATVTSSSTSVGDEYYIEATATDPYSGSNTATSSTAIVQEARVTITNIDWTNRPVYDNDDTSVTYSSSGTQTGDYFEITVYKNSAQFATATDSYTLSNTNTVQTDEFYYTIQAYNSSDQVVSAEYTSPTITIQNHVPILSNLEYNSNKLIDGNSFSIYTIPSDDDTDNVNISWRLYKNSTLYQSGTVTNATLDSQNILYTVPNSEVHTGDIYYFEANVTDGLNISPTSTSNTKTVIEVQNFTITAKNIWDNTSINAFTAQYHTLTNATSDANINTQEYAPTGITWNNDGTKLYEIGFESDKIYEYNVATPYNITTATLDTNINTQDNTPTGVTWNNDGTKLYEVGHDSAKIYEYNVATPYDITTATLNTNINTQDNSPSGITWNNDGTKLYEIGWDSSKIYEYNVATPYNITTATLNTNINTQDSYPSGMTWNNDGTKLYEIGRGNDKIYQYEVKTPYDITTTTLKISIDSQDSSSEGISINNDGTKLYEIGKNSDKIYQYDINQKYGLEVYEATTKNTTTGSIITQITENIITNITITANNYFTKTYTKYNTSTNLQASLSQSIIKFNVEELFTENTLNANITINTTTRETGEVFNLAAGNYIATVSKPSYYNKDYNVSINTLDNRTITLQEYGNSIINLTVNDTQGNPINTSYELYDDGIEIATGNITNGNIDISVLRDENYTLQLGGDDYFQESLNVSVTNSIENVSQTMFNKNVVTISFRKLSDKSLITQQANYTLKSDQRTYEGKTSSGEISFEAINGYYTLTAESIGYVKAQYMVSIPSSRQEQNVSVYMVQENGQSLTEFNVINNYDNSVTDAVVNIQIIDNGTSYSVSQKKTDFTGKVTFLLDPTIEYTVIASKQEYDTFTGKITPIDSAYTLRINELGAQPVQSIFEDIYFQTNYNYDNTSNTINFTYFITSYNGKLTSYQFQTEYNNTVHNTIVTDKPSGSLETITINNYNPSDQSTFKVQYQFTAEGQTYSWNETYTIMNINPYDTDFNLSNKTGLLIAVGVLLITIAVGYSTGGQVVANLFGIIGLGAMALFSLIPLSAGIVGITIMILLLWQSSSAGGGRE